VLYHTLAKAIKDSAALASIVTLGLAGLATDLTLTPALALWSRRSELTADRAGLLACQEQDVALRALMKLAGYPPLFYPQMHPRSLVAQAYSFRTVLLDQKAERFFNISNLWNASHPYTALRALELLDWVQDGMPHDLLKMDAAELERVSSSVETDAEVAELTFTVSGLIADWAADKFQVARSQARRTVRKMMDGSMSGKHTVLERILQIQVTVKKVNSAQIEYWIYLLVNENNKPVRVSIPIARDPSWDNLPQKLREDFILSSGLPELNWILYSIK
jgi:hypothetical protein